MNAITDTFRALWRRKLWPVAVLLVAALAAVPTLLAKEPTVEPAPVVHAKADAGLPATFVSAAERAEDGERRRVLGEQKDPFEPAELSKKDKAARKKAEAKIAAETKRANAEQDAPKSGGGDAGSGGGGGTIGVPPVSVAPTPAPTYPLYSIKVRFGKVDGDLTTKTVERLKVLPSASSPVLVYRGVEEGGKVAVFELTGSVVAQGDGKCEPTPEDCQLLKLKVGETEFLTVSDTGTETDAQYQLELQKINTKTTTSKSELAKASSAGREFLDALSADRKTRYVYDDATGTLHKVDAKSASKLTRAARRASL